MTAADPYDTSVTVDDVNVVFRRWRAWSDDVRAHTLHARDLRYGPSADETLDLVVPHTGAPLVVFFHGGFWRRLHKDDFTFVARGLAPHGVAVAIVNYGLAPAVPLEEIVAQARRSVAWLRANATAHGADPSRIVVARTLRRRTPRRDVRGRRAGCGRRELERAARPAPARDVVRERVAANSTTRAPRR